MTPDLQQKLDTFRKLRSAATKGPVHKSSRQSRARGSFRALCELSPFWLHDIQILCTAAGADESGHGRQHRDADYIAFCFNTAPAIIEALVEENQRLRATIDANADPYRRFIDAATPTTEAQ